MIAATHMSEPTTARSTSLSEWIEHHQAWLWRYLRFLGAATDVAEDVCQETLMAALHHEIPDRAQPTAVAWLRRTSCNFFKKQLRRARQHDAMKQLVSRDQLVRDDELLEKADGDRDALRHCLQQLSGDARTVLDMRYRDNASRAAMATATGRSEEGIKTLLRRVKEQLRKCIERRRTS